MDNDKDTKTIFTIWHLALAIILLFVVLGLGRMGLL